MEKINRTKPLLEQMKWQPTQKKEYLEPKRKKCILFAGPSCAGKTTLITQLLSADTRLAIPHQVTTRAQRAGYTDKSTVSTAEFAQLEAGNDFFHKGTSYGNLCGTLKSSVENLVRSEKIPVLDFPLALIPELKAANPDFEFIVFYILPKTLQEWYQRMVATERNSFTRLKASLSEFHQILAHDQQDTMIIIENGDNAQNTALQKIQQVIESYLADTGDNASSVE